MIKLMRSILRKIPLWVTFQEVRREGVINVYKRQRIQKKILNTAPMHLESEGDIEVHVLTWRKDYINLIWSLKTFYTLGEKSFPLVIHDGGLHNRHKSILLKHFPQARIIDKTLADKEVGDYLDKKGFSKSKEYRLTNVASLKLFDYKHYSRAKRIIHIDSDIVFFKKPKEFIDYIEGSLSVFNKDMSYAYSIAPTALEKLVGEPIPHLINSGLFIVDVESLNLELIEVCLKESSELFSNKWVTEQTLHAICATKHGYQFLSKNYLISTHRGLPEDIVCKHYTGFFRPLFYQEGLQEVVNKSVLDFF